MDEVNDYFGDIDLFLLDWILKGGIAQGANILDAGSGSGRNLVYFLNENFHVRALDKNQSEIDLLNYSSTSLGFGEIGIVGDIESLPYQSDNFDFVICSRVLHFADNIDSFWKMMGELKRVLTPGGVLYLSMASSIGMRLDSEISKNGRMTFPDGSVRFVLTPEILSKLDADWTHKAIPRTVIFHETHEETTLIITPV